jgi:hypothetical protein
MILSNFRRTRTKDRIESYRIFFRNLGKKKQRIKLSNLFQIKIKILEKNWLFQTNTTKYDFFIFILKKVSSYSTPVIHVIDEYYTTKPF